MLRTYVRHDPDSRPQDQGQDEDINLQDLDQDNIPNNTLNNTQFSHSDASTMQVHQHFKQGVSHSGMI